ncbi:MAG: hypothetical protein QOH04_162 [Sphingomonadales bacterium]|jgi:hypothetical protein|nr:hypothetical protein [Sphingomonadales bacterium]
MFLLAFAHAATSAATTPPSHAGDCKWVHGRYTIYNGSGVRRIWVIGTRRLIALHDGDRDVPPEIDAYAQGFTSYRGFADALSGDFYVCARERSRPGWIQHVRLAKTRHLVFHGKPFRAQ